MNKDVLSDLISRRIRDDISVKSELLFHVTTIADVARLQVEAYRKGKKVLLFGNGGSAADSQHIAAELVGSFYNRERPGIAALALTVNTSSLTAIANDYSYDDVFARQVEAFGQKGDVAIGLSTSGNSQNVIRAVKTAKARGLSTVSLTGKSGGLLKDEVDFCVRVPSDDTPRIQEAHILIGHILCEIIERELFSN